MKYIKTYEFFKRKVKERTWNNAEYGFRIPEFLLSIVDKNLNGYVKLEITISNFFGNNSYSYFENLLVVSKIEKYIKDFNIENLENSDKQHKFIVNTYILNWYEFLRQLDDGHLINVKILSNTEK